MSYYQSNVIQVFLKHVECTLSVGNMLPAFPHTHTLLKGHRSRVTDPNKTQKTIFIKALSLSVDTVLILQTV